MLESFLIHEDKLFALLVKVLVRATLHAYVFQFLPDVESAFDHIAANDVFQGRAHDRIAFPGLYVKEVDAEVELAVETDTGPFLDVLRVNHFLILLLL